MRGYRYQTRRGYVYILPKHGRWQVVYDGDGLGSYHSPHAAADDVAGGHTDTPSNGVDLGSAGIPDSITEWETF